MRGRRRSHADRQGGRYRPYGRASRRRRWDVSLRAAHRTAFARRALVHRFANLKRAVILILDGVGIGEAPDAAEYGDTGSNTLGNVARACGGLELPRLERF